MVQPSTTSSGSTAERRLGTRVAVQLAARCDESAAPLRIVDLSLDGARCVGLSPSARGPLELDLDLPGEPGPLRVLAVPVGISGSATHLRFVDLRTRDRVKLAHALW